MPVGDPAPLLSLPGAAFAPGAGAIWCEGADGLPLRAAYFAAPRPIGSVVLSPGRTEPIEKYVEVVGELLQRGYCVLIHDWRGQGLSGRLLPDRLRGHAEGFDAFVDDFRTLIDRFEPDLPQPRIALGHSMGGCLTLAALARGERRFSAAILSSPMLGLNTGGVPAWQARLMAAAMRWAGRGGDYLLGGPTDPFNVAFEKDRLTHDRVRYARARAQILAEPDLALGQPTWGWLASAYGAIDRLARSPQVNQIAIPVILVAAGEESLVRNADSRRMAERLPKGRYVEIAGAYHELLMETDDIRAQFWAQFDHLAGSVARSG